MHKNSGWKQAETNSWKEVTDQQAAKVSGGWEWWYKFQFTDNVTAAPAQFGVGAGAVVTALAALPNQADKPKPLSAMTWFAGRL